MKINPIFLADSYKLSHKSFEIDGVQNIYSNFTPRFDHYFKAKYPDFDGDVVSFGQQYLVRKLHTLWNENFFNRPKDEVIQEAKRVLLPYIGMDNLDHFEALHDLGYLPIEVKSLPEGEKSAIGIPVLTITNTHKDFEWLVNYLETFISVELWKPITVATIVKQFRELADSYAFKTTGDKANAMFQLHDFSFRGQSGYESSAISGAAFLTNSHGTDNVPAIMTVEHYYDANIDNELLAGSVPASEHSVTTLGILSLMNKGMSLVDAETEFLKDVIVNKFPEGIVSYVSDSFDYWNVIGEILPRLQAEILERDGKLVIRPDSGDPVEVLCGSNNEFIVIDKDVIQTYEMFLDTASRDIEDDLREFTPHGEHGSESHGLHFKWNDKFYHVQVTNFEWNRHDKQYYYIDQNSKFEYIVEELTATVESKGTVEALWDIFGGTVNEQGYKELDSHIGIIYGDGITYQRAAEIFAKLEAKGFASTNVVFGIGSYSLAMLSRDDLGFAIKATSAVVNGQRIAIFKDPKTDSSKKSAKGLLYVGNNENNEYFLESDVSEIREEESWLKTIYRDGNFYNKTTLDMIRKRTELIEM